MDSTVLVVVKRGTQTRWYTPLLFKLRQVQKLVATQTNARARNATSQPILLASLDQLAVTHA